MTRNVKKFSQEEFSKIVDEFIKKSVSVILQSRIPSKELQKQTTKNTYISDLKPLSETQNIHLVIHIYYNYDKVKLLCEKFSLKINLKKPKEEEYIRKRLIKKLSSFVRSLYSVTRVLPGFYFFQNKKFDFSLDYNIYYNPTQKLEKIPNKSQKIIINLDSDLGSIQFKVRYFLKNQIFILEKELESKKLEEKTSNLSRRSRVLSENLCSKFPELHEEKKEITKITIKTKSNHYIDTDMENNNQSNRLSMNNINTKNSPKRINKQGDFFSINSCSYSDDYKYEKNKSPNSIDFFKKEMKMFTAYLSPTELNLEKTSSSETSSLDSYELEFDSNNEENSLSRNELKKGEEIFIFDEMVSKIKNFKKMIKNNSYRPLIINYKSFMKVN